MIKIQTDLNNFSVFEDILAFFTESNLDNGISIEQGIIRADIHNCPKCKSKTVLNGYREF